MLPIHTAVRSATGLQTPGLAHRTGTSTNDFSARQRLRLRHPRMHQTIFPRGNACVYGIRGCTKPCGRDASASRHLRLGTRPWLGCMRGAQGRPGRCCVWSARPSRPSGAAPVPFRRSFSDFWLENDFLFWQFYRSYDLTPPFSRYQLSIHQTILKSVPYFSFWIFHLQFLSLLN